MPGIISPEAKNMFSLGGLEKESGAKETEGIETNPIAVLKQGEKTLEGLVTGNQELTGTLKNWKAKLEGDNPIKLEEAPKVIETSAGPVNVDTNRVETLESMESTGDVIEGAIDQINEAAQNGDIDAAISLSKELVSHMEVAGKENLTPDVKQLYKNVVAYLDAAEASEGSKTKKLLWRTGCGALDFIPVGGPLKMLYEAKKGQTLGGENLRGWKRTLHGTLGAVYLGLDCTGVGALGKVAKGGSSMPKIIQASSEILKGVGASEKLSRPLIAGGKAIAGNPELAGLAATGFMHMGKIRKEGVMATSGVEKPTPGMMDKLKQYAIASERPGMKEEQPSI